MVVDCREKTIEKGLAAKRYYSFQLTFAANER